MKLSRSSEVVGRGEGHAHLYADLIGVVIEAFAWRCPESRTLQQVSEPGA